MAALDVGVDTAAVAPSARAATTNSRSVRLSVTARATRVKAGMPSTPITRVMLRTDWPR